jgi:hypothetical protein
MSDAINKYIKSCTLLKYPILKEVCIINDWNSDYVTILRKSSAIINDAVQKLFDTREVALERGMQDGSLNVTGSIFMLKQPVHGFTDKPVLDNNSGGLDELKEIFSTILKPVTDNNGN